MFRFYLLLLVLVSNFATSQDLALPLAKNLLEDAQLVRKNETPILIMFSIPNCPYCQKVKQEVIAPMNELDEYKNKVIIRHVNAGTLKDMKDFYNNDTNHGRFAFQNGINFYPTIFLMDNYGANLGKIIGVPSMDYYWTELDKVIDKSITKLKRQLKAEL
ncbi:conserved hypothetical protein [Isorropodon fossajaponicum endosymbiont JTNG4]|uniref:thioredoxin family protein n=1 Tax=Isorropodon fossajaponicum symbiont TaxID=883811 RepID=UPI001915511C|nr:thioredoxin fold domain-containing protein [Isorropodon fossajaponicum symbiont]BBB23502.1 conserved hypothetical protein [Isorropodon fossajaponicum endosymbiont JTNG4]